MKTILHIAARFLVALIFILSGVGKAFAFGATAAMMSDAGFPAPSFFLVCAIVIELFGGILLLAGYAAKYAAAALVVFLIPATIIFHAAGITDPVHGQEQMIHTLKNLAILGGLLKFATDGAGLFALDNPGGTKKNDQENQPKAAMKGAVSV